MSPEALDDNTIRRYLLGFADELEQQRVEEALLLDEAGHRQIAIIEDELIEQYLAGELNREERAAFESYFLAPKSRRQNLRFARVLQNYIKDHPEANTAPSRSLWFTMPRLAMAAAVIAVIAASWLAIHNRPSAPIQVARTQVATADKAAPQPFVLTLSPGLLRGSGSEPVLDQRPSAQSIELHLALPQETVGFASYSATLTTVEGHEVWRGSDLKAENGSVKVVVPTSSLSRGDWRVALAGTSAKGKSESISSYYFRVLFE